MACHLRVDGRRLDPEFWLRQMRVVATYVGHRGDRLPGNRKSRTACFNVNVSGRGFGEFSRQIADAKRFLRTHSALLRQLTDHATVEHAVLDFGISALVDCREVFAQFITFPADLVALAADVGVALEVSLYPVTDSRKDKRTKTR